MISRLLPASILCIFTYTCIPCRFPDKRGVFMRCDLDDHAALNSPSPGGDALCKWREGGSEKGWWRHSLVVMILATVGRDGTGKLGESLKQREVRAPHPHEVTENGNRFVRTRAVKYDMGARPGSCAILPLENALRVCPTSARQSRTSRFCFVVRCASGPSTEPR